MAEKPIYTNTALSKMKAHGLSETQVNDVFFRGTPEGKNKMIKKYSGYEIGLFYAQRDGKFIITTVWKRGNRR